MPPDQSPPRETIEAGLHHQNVEFLQTQHGDQQHHHQEKDVAQKVAPDKQRQQHKRPERDGTAEAAKENHSFAGRVTAAADRALRNLVQPCAKTLAQDQRGLTIASYDVPRHLAGPLPSRATHTVTAPHPAGRRGHARQNTWRSCDVRSCSVHEKITRSRFALPTASDSDKIRASPGKIHPVVIYPIPTAQRLFDLKELYELIARLDADKDTYARPITVIDRKTVAAMESNRAFHEFSKNTVSRHSEILDGWSVDTCQMWYSGLGQAFDQGGPDDVYWLIPGDFNYGSPPARKY